MPKITINETRARAIIRSLLREAKGDNLHQFIDYIKQYSRPGHLTATENIPTVNELCEMSIYDTSDFETYLEYYDIESDDENSEEINKIISSECKNIASNVLNNITINERGLIYIERNIMIPTFTNAGTNFNTFAKKYKGHLGTSWSYEYGQVVNGGFPGATNEVSLKGWIDPASIYWSDVVRLHACFDEEYELPLKDNSPIEIEAITAIGNNGREHVIWNTPVIMKA